MITHSTVATSVWRALRRRGRSEFTTLPSSADMKVPVPTAARTHHLLTGVEAVCLCVDVDLDFDRDDQVNVDDLSRALPYLCRGAARGACPGTPARGTTGRGLICARGGP